MTFIDWLPTIITAVIFGAAMGGLLVHLAKREGSGYAKPREGWDD